MSLYKNYYEDCFCELVAANPGQLLVGCGPHAVGRHRIDEAEPAEPVCVGTVSATSDIDKCVS